jgi:hypothetical protein
MRIYQCGKNSAEEFLQSNNRKTLSKAWPKNAFKKPPFLLIEQNSSDEEDTSVWSLKNKSEKKIPEKKPSNKVANKLLSGRLIST